MLNSVIRPPLNVHLYLTPVCNLRCTHCYFDAWWVDRKPENLISTESISTIITSLHHQFNTDFHMEGGEVFLRSDLPELFDRVPEECWRDVTLTTGGTAPIRVDYAHLRKLGDLRISVEGHTDELQRLIRGVPLRPVLRTCEALRAHDVPFTLRITLFKRNFSLFREMVDAFREQGVSRFSFFEFQPVGRGSAQAEYELAESDVAEVLASLASASLPEGVEELKLSLRPDRVAHAERFRASLERRGFELVSLRGVPSLTVNSDGAVGVSPWKITADRVADHFSTFSPATFARDVEDAFGSGLLNVHCAHTSAVQVRHLAHRRGPSAIPGPLSNSPANG